MGRFSFAPKGGCDDQIHRGTRSRTHFGDLKHGTADDRKRFVETLPDNTLKNGALALVGSDNPGMVVLALTALITKYCTGQHPEIGAALALAVHTLALEIFEGGEGHGLMPMTLSGLAYQYVNALNLLGESDQVIAFTDRYIPYYERLNEVQNLPSLKVARINALVNLRRIDEADMMLSDSTLRGNWAADIEIQRLENQVKRLKQPITSISSNLNEGELRAASVEVMRRALKKAIGQTFDQENQRDSAVKAVEGLDKEMRLDPSSPEGSRSLSQLLDIGTQFLTGGSGEMSEWVLKKKIRDATGIFVLEANPAPARLRESLAVLQDSLRLAEGANLVEQQNDALWGMYLCRNRLKEPSAAVDALLKLRTNLEAVRAGIKEPLQRGGVFAVYPHIFDALCNQLQKAGRTEELLTAIEASKGRGVADILTEKSGGVVADSSIYGAAASLPALTRHHGFQYLTYYVETDRTHAVLVSKDGSIHQLGPIMISKEDIRRASRCVDPRVWGQPAEYDASLLIEDVSASLAPLVAVLEPLLDAGSLVPGDHISYSADDTFNNVPLQYLKFRDKRLIDFFSVSRVHNAFHLQQVLEKDVAGPPSQFASFVVPVQQDLTREEGKRRRASQSRPTAWLAEHLDGQAFENEDASFSRLESIDACNKVVQFSTHGIFPRDDEAQNPFRKSGLLLSDGKALPDQDGVALGAIDCVLTPSKIVDMKLDFRGSHVSLMACVSGLSREGLGGDALGMDWAFIQAGATSLLSSHWYVSAELAADFFVRFYERWITRGNSRAVAIRDTVRSLRAGKGSRARPYSWGSV